MKRMRIAPLLAALVFAASTGWVNAQTAATAAAAPATRAQIKMERDEFLKSHTWDSMSENWVVKPGYESPVGTKSRAEIKAERDEILRNNRWDELSGTWVPLKGKPRELSTLSREQVRAETRAFVRTHSWDEVTESWLEKPRAKRK